MIFNIQMISKKKYEKEKKRGYIEKEKEKKDKKEKPQKRIIQKVLQMKMSLLIRLVCSIIQFKHDCKILNFC